MNIATLTLRRPVAVTMFFLAIALVGLVGWQRMPVELFPVLQGNQLYVNFGRPGSEPEVLEREILLPLQAGVSTLPRVTETFGEIRGSSGRFEVSFEAGTQIKVSELELQRLASTLRRTQPADSWINVSSMDTSAISSFAMNIHVLGGDDEDINALHDLVEDRVVPRFAAVPGVSQAFATGGAPRQVTVVVDPDRATALGVTTEAVTETVRRNAAHIRFLGELESEDGRTAVMLDGRPAGLDSLGEARILGAGPVRLKHVGHLEFGTAREERQFRVNGEPAVGLVVFQEQGANVVRLGEELRQRVAELGEEMRPLGIEFVIGFDAAETVQDQISHLGRLGLSGFVIALIVLFIFLRQWRAVAVVGLAVPVSLLAALTFLFLLGLSLNLITLFGLALAVGLVVDNSVVVYESVQRGLERGVGIEDAVSEGLHRTVRAIVAASATTAVVFLPLVVVDFEDEFVRELIKVVTLAILLPLLSSLLVAIALVPLLAHRLAAPAARRKLERDRARRAEHGHLVPPDRGRILFGGVVARALRQPAAWLAGIVGAVMLTGMIALPWVMVNTSSQEQEADTVQLSIRFSSRGSIENNSAAMAQLESAALEIEGVDMVEAQIQEDGGTLTVHLADREVRPLGLRAQTVRNAISKAAKRTNAQVLRPGEEQMGGGKGGGGGRGGGQPGAFGGAPAEVVMSGPESAVLERLAESVRAQLESMPQVRQAWLPSQPGMDEIWVEPNVRAFESFGLTFDSVLSSLSLAGREGERMQTGFILPNGRELPLVVERIGAREEKSGRRKLSRMRVHTEAGAVPVSSLASMRRMPPPPLIMHHNGRREISVFYRLDNNIPSTGPSRLAIDEQIDEAVRGVPRPRGYAVETVEQDESTNWFQKVLVPVVLLLFLVMAMTFESLTMPVLVLIALPLTLLGATWALAFAGMPLGMMAMLGALALIGLTVNPAILLVDRMQQFVLGSGWSAGAAAFAAVRERTRPVLMTTATTVAGLWPLAITTGRENEIWPPFATIVIGGLITSSVLTLLIIPVGFILLRKLDALFGRVGPWLVLAWLGGTVIVMTALILSGLVTSMFWQVVLSFLVGGFLLAVVVMVFRPRAIPEPDCSNGPPKLEVRFLRKVYGIPGPFRRALMAQKAFAERVLAAGGVAFDVTHVRERLMPLALSIGGIVYVATQVQSMFWTLVFGMIAAAVVARFVVELRRARGLADAVGNVQPGGVENWVAASIPWLALALMSWALIVPRVENADAIAGAIVLTAIAAILLTLVQGARRSARRQADGTIGARVSDGALRYPRNLWRRWAAKFGGLDLPSPEVLALAGINFTVERGMVGILGPNGAGKTTLLRQLAGVLDPTRGTIHLGGVHYPEIQNYLSRWIGYLPQDAGLPGGLTPKEYMSYFAALYDIERDLRAERVDSLLEEVGLAEKVDDPIKSLSGGMRQRVAVARTLLRLPPVIIVDEPTVGLDPRERIRFRNLLSRLGEDRIVLFSTHVVEDVAVACERVLVLADGQLVFDGQPGQLSSVAQGRVWELRLPQDQTPDLPAGAIHAEEAPLAGGNIAHRILSTDSPGEGAQSVDATLEDGYMWLVAQSSTHNVGTHTVSAQDGQP